MTFFALNSFQILTLTALLVPSLATIWVVFLQRDLTEKTLIFKKALKEYGKVQSLELFKDIQTFCQDSENEDDEESLGIIMNFMEDWQCRNVAISKLLENENSIYKTGRQVLLILFALFVSGLYSSSNPAELFIGTLSRIEIAQVLFTIEFSLIFYWFYKIYDFGIILNKIQSGELEDIEELIKNTIAKMEKDKK